MRTPVFAVLAATLLAAACAPSPFYTGRVRVTPGEIPRDAYGQPVWDAIPPAPPGPATVPAPAPRTVQVHPIP